MKKKNRKLLIRSTLVFHFVYQDLISTASVVSILKQHDNNV